MTSTSQARTSHISRTMILSEATNLFAAVPATAALDAKYKVILPLRSVYLPEKIEQGNGG